MFTENLREAFRSVNFMRRWFIKIYNATRIPVRPVYGGFPVKFRTYLGKPIPYEPNVTPEQLQEKVIITCFHLIIIIISILFKYFIYLGGIGY